MVRAKFKVEKKEGGAGDSQTVVLAPVTSGSPENERYFKYTPSGAIHLNTINAEAADQFNIGDEFYVDFTPVPKATEEAKSSS